VVVGPGRHEMNTLWESGRGRYKLRGVVTGGSIISLSLFFLFHLGGFETKKAIKLYGASLTLLSRSETVDNPFNVRAGRASSCW